MKVLIVGGAGYVGGVIVDLLLSKIKYDVTVYDNLLYEESYRKNCKFINGDIRDKNFILPHYNESDIIIPLAAYVGAPLCDKDKTGAQTVNHDAIIMMLESLRDEQIVLMPTTNSAYGSGNKDNLCDETSPLNPISKYAVDKVSIEKKLMERENSISFRLATVFGMSPKMRIDLLVNDFVYKAMNDRSLVLFEENFKRNFVHVDDVAEAYLYSLEKFSELKNNIYNLGLSTANLTKKELALKIKEYLPNTEIISSEIGKDPDKRNYIVSNKKIEDAGFTAKRSLDLGIKELIKYYSFITKKNSNI